MFNANILTYPLKFMNITQTYNGTTSHKPHTTGTPKDYPIDDGAENSGQSYFYCPCDEMKIVKKYTSGTNTLWLESTKPVITACGTQTVICMQVTHMNDSTMNKLSVGQTFKRGQAMFLEGSDGATANHFHISIGKGSIKGNGWAKNTNGKWVLTTTGGTYKPENAFFIDKSFTTIKNANGLSFKEVPAKYYTASTTATAKATTTATSSTASFLPSRGYFKKGDTSTNIGKIAKFMRNTFPTYTSEKALGNYFGDNLLSAVKTFQKNTGLTVDGYIGKLTLAMLKKYGFTE